MRVRQGTGDQTDSSETSPLADMGLGVDPYSGNRYAFTAGNPISRIEADGHDWLSDAGNWVADLGSSLLDQTVAGLEGTANWAIQWGTGFVGCLKEDQATCDQAVAAGEQMSLESQWAGLKSDVSGIQAGYESGSSAVATAIAVLLVGDFASRKPKPQGAALGFDTPRGTVADFARKNGLANYMHLSYPDWVGPVKRDIADASVPIHVLTAGFDEFGGFEQMAQTGMRKLESQATQWEMAWLAYSVNKGERPWSSITFYDANQRPMGMSEPNWGDWEIPEIFEIMMGGV